MYSLRTGRSARRNFSVFRLQIFVEIFEDDLTKPGPLAPALHFAQLLTGGE